MSNPSVFSLIPWFLRLFSNTLSFKRSIDTNQSFVCILHIVRLLTDCVWFARVQIGAQRRSTSEHHYCRRGCDRSRGQCDQCGNGTRHRRREDQSGHAHYGAGSCAARRQSERFRSCAGMILQFYNLHQFVKYFCYNNAQSMRCVCDCRAAEWELKRLWL